MNVLYVISDFPNGGKANVNIAYDIKSYLESNDVHVFLYGSFNTSDKKNHIIPLDYVTRLFCKIQESNSFFAKVYKKLYGMFFMKHDVYEKVYLRMTKKIKNIAKKYQIDAIIAFVAPHEFMNIVYSEIEAPIYFYMLDPRFSHYKFKEEAKELEVEEEYIIKRVEKLFLTPLLFQDYMNSNILKSYERKFISLDFPKVNNDVYINNNTGELYKVVFFGNLYNDIRNPEPIIKIFSKLSLHNISVEFYGNNYGFKKNQLKDLEDKFGFVKFNRPVDMNKVNELIQSSDFLLNIGNSISNQMPSKIIEYINTGKPIINCMKIENCPTLKYTSNYALSINFTETNASLDELLMFIKNSKGSLIEKSEILKNYEFCTLDYVGNKVLHALQSGGQNGKI